LVSTLHTFIANFIALSVSSVEMKTRKSPVWQIFDDQGSRHPACLGDMEALGARKKELL